MRSRKDSWPVVDGERVKPYALPPDPAGDLEQMKQMEIDARRAQEHRATIQRRSLTAVVDALKARKGDGFEVTLCRRWTLEFHRRPRGDGKVWRLELYRYGRFGLNIEFFRRAR